MVGLNPGIELEPIGRKLTHVVDKGAETLGRAIAKGGLNFFKEILQRKVKDFRLDCTGGENLTAFEGKPVIIAANHVITRDSKGKKTLPTVDAFVVERAVREQTGRGIRTVAQYDDHRMSPNKSAAYWLKHHVVDRVYKGAMNAMGAIPVNRTPGTFKREFVGEVNRAVMDRQIVLVFPEVRWHEDGAPIESTRELEPGAAHIALKYGIPIVPAYLEGCGTWNPKAAVKVRFGQPIDPVGLKGDMTQKLLQSMQQLQHI